MAQRQPIHYDPFTDHREEGKVTHTPGPWYINGGRIQHQGLTEYGNLDDPDEIATVGIVNQQAPRDTANARLIAAAPELLAALEYAAAAMSSKPVIGERLRDATEVARAAISKAEA